MVHCQIHATTQSWLSWYPGLCDGPLRKATASWDAGRALSLQEEEVTVRNGSNGMIWGKPEIGEGEDLKIILRDFVPRGFLF